MYDLIPAGIGFSERLFDLHSELITQTYSLVKGCTCSDGCPSCVGPGGEGGTGGKKETLALMERLI
jgi:DEAD/DEAH box helicase domain-containing protein